MGEKRQIVEQTLKPGPRGNQTIAIFRGRQNIAADYFTELVIVRMTNDKIGPEKLTDETILVAPRIATNGVFKRCSGK